MADAYDVVVIGAGTGGWHGAQGSAVGQARRARRARRPTGWYLPDPRLHPDEGVAAVRGRPTIERSQEWGIKASGDPDWSAVRAFEDKIVDKLVKGVEGLVKSRGITVLHGTAKLLPGPRCRWTAAGRHH